MSARTIQHSHGDNHTHAHASPKAALGTAFALTALVLVVEVVGGIASHSLALLSDAGHVLTDIVALGLAWFAAVQAERPSDDRRTYGYHRVGILAALANAITLIAIVVWIAYEAIHRLQAPEQVTPWIMFVAASVGVAVNLFIGLRLRHQGQHNINVRAAMLHVFGDVGASAAVIVGGIVIALTGWYPADPIISLAIALLIAWGAWSVLRETIAILMESTPRDVDVTRLLRDLGKIPGVSGVHDLHVWSIAGGMRALSAHIQVIDRPISACDALRVKISALLREDYSIGHSTLQFECRECDRCDGSNLYCQLDPGESAHTHMHGHGHSH
ncbi:MAG TPA: cation diffusion facilitator family transporter [Ktedonobacterales bacterium]|nr:cation diffusion facilitator family transporter [Ktedonobacterales bacterium]